MELSDEEQDALSNLTRTLRSRFGANDVILYGSAARGELDEESDLDLLVVLPTIDWQIQKEIIGVCFDAELKCGRVISVICYTTDELEHSPLRSSPLVLTARREGASAMNADVRRLIDYRPDQAAETLDAARQLSAAGYYRDAVNRAYYAMFYCGLAVLASKRLGASKHSGVLSLFNRYFIKTGEFPLEYGRHLREAFELRQGSDCREFVEITAAQAQETIAHAKAFLLYTRRTLAGLEG